MKSAKKRCADVRNVRIRALTSLSIQKILCYYEKVIAGALIKCAFKINRNRSGIKMKI